MWITDIKGEGSYSSMRLKSRWLTKRWSYNGRNTSEILCSIVTQRCVFVCSCFVSVVMVNANMLPQSLVGGRKLWVGLSLYEHCGPCRRQFTAVFVDNPSSRKLMKWSCSRPSLWDPSLVAPLVLLVWPKSLGHRTAMDLATIHCSFHHFREVYNIGKVAFSQALRPLLLNHFLLICCSKLLHEA